MKHRPTLCAGVALTALGLALATVPRAQAATVLPVERTVELRPVHCHPVVCTQRRIVTTYYHGVGALVETDRRTRPVESRNLGTTPAWSTWSLVSVYLSVA